jgi:hypothetical protein
MKPEFDVKEAILAICAMLLAAAHHACVAAEATAR